MLRRDKNKRKSSSFITASLKDAAGYTLVEIIVMLSIISIIMGLTFGAYQGLRKENYIKHVANLTQTNIRDTFIDILATKVESTGTICASKAPKVKATRIMLGRTSSPVSKVALCFDTATNILIPNEVETSINPSAGINYKQDIYVTCENCTSTGSEDSSGYLYLAFTSPYGKYYAYYTSQSDPDTDFNSLGTGGSESSWIMDQATQIYSPLSSDLTFSRDLVIKFNSDPDGGAGIIHQITISKNGNVKLD